MPQRFFKQSPALEDYDFDWSGWLVDGDFITSFTVTADDGVTLGDVLHQQGSPIIKQFVGGGTHGNSYKVTCAIRTDQGRADVAQVIILIRDIGTGGQPIPPPLEEDLMPPVITDITTLITFPQSGVSFVASENSTIFAVTSGALVTLTVDVDIVVPAGLTHIEMVLPPNLAAKDGIDFAGTYLYSYYATDPVVGPNIKPGIAGVMFIQPRTGPDRISFYPTDFTVFPQLIDIYIAGQMTYVSRS